MEDNHQVALVIILGICFLPGIIASTRHHNNTLAINVLNLCTIIGAVFWMAIGSVFGGVLVGIWLIPLAVIGWLVALIWSCTANVQVKVESIRIEQPRRTKQPMPRFWQSVSQGSKERS